MAMRTSISSELPDGISSLPFFTPRPYPTAPNPQDDGILEIGIPNGHFISNGTVMIYISLSTPQCHLFNPIDCTSSNAYPGMVFEVPFDQSENRGAEVQFLTFKSINLRDAFRPWFDKMGPDAVPMAFSIDVLVPIDMWENRSVPEGLETLTYSLRYTQRDVSTPIEDNVYYSVYTEFTRDVKPFLPVLNLGQVSAHINTLSRSNTPSRSTIKLESPHRHFPKGTVVDLTLKPATVTSLQLLKHSMDSKDCSFTTTNVYYPQDWRASYTNGVMRVVSSPKDWWLRNFEMRCNNAFSVVGPVLHYQFGYEYPIKHIIYTGAVVNSDWPVIQNAKTPKEIELEAKQAQMNYNNHIAIQYQQEYEFRYNSNEIDYNNNSQSTELQQLSIQPSQQFLPLQNTKYDTSSNTPKPSQYFNYLSTKTKKNYLFVLEVKGPDEPRPRLFELSDRMFTGMGRGEWLVIYIIISVFGTFFAFMVVMIIYACCFSKTPAPASKDPRYQTISVMELDADTAGMYRNPKKTEPKWDGKAVGSTPTDTTGTDTTGTDTTNGTTTTNDTTIAVNDNVYNSNDYQYQTDNEPAIYQPPTNNNDNNNGGGVELTTM